MKTRMSLMGAMGVMLCGLARAQSPLVPLPLTPPTGVAPYTWSNALYWTNPVVPSTVQVWQFNWGVRTNLGILQGEIDAFTAGVPALIDGRIAGASLSATQLTSGSVSTNLIPKVTSARVADSATAGPSGAFGTAAYTAATAYDPAGAAAAATNNLHLPADRVDGLGTNDTSKLVWNGGAGSSNTLTNVVLIFTNPATGKSMFINRSGNGISMHSESNAVMAADWMSFNVYTTAHFHADMTLDGGSYSGSGAGLTDIPVSGIVGLGDAQTNAMLQSWKIVQTNVAYFFATNNTTNVFGSFTNLAGVNYSPTSGVANVLWSTDGSHWLSGGDTLVTNVAVQLAFFGGILWGQGISNYSALNGDCRMTNVTVWALARPDLFGKTNQLIGQSLRVGTPSNPDDATPMWYVQSQTAGLLSASVNQDVSMQANYLWMNGTWNVHAPSFAGGADALSFNWLGQPAATLYQPAAVSITNISGTASGTNVVIKVATNGVAGPPTLLLSHYLRPVNWVSITNTATVSGTNYQYTVAKPWTDEGFIIGLLPSVNPFVLSLAGLMQLAPRTITNSTDSTYGFGAGLGGWDSNYVYISVGTNLWKRSALSSW